MKILLTNFILIISLVGFSSFCFAQEETQDNSPQTISREAQIKAYKGIYEKLKRLYPDLTAEELKQHADRMWYQKMHTDHAQLQTSSSNKLDNVEKDTSFNSQN